eukprot:m.627870 g.627870  ORF g.627870 m.627870 type:complete len:51 (+) comp22562_c0_seq7:6551-6703(+)
MPRSRLEAIREGLPLNDYSVSQSSLSQVFRRFAQQDEHANTSHTASRSTA